MEQQNDLEKRPYISIFLILLAFVALSVAWFFIITLGVIYYAIKGKVVTYVYHVGISIDYLFATMIFGTKGHTVSAIVYKREYWEMVRFVNWLFRDRLHCKDAYEKEFLK